MKNLKSVLIAFTLPLTMTIVYASYEAGWFTIGGTVTFTDVRLQLNSDDGVVTGRTLYFNNLIFDEEDNTQTTTSFTIRNIGRYSVVIKDVETTHQGLNVTILPVDGAPPLAPGAEFPFGPAVHEYEIIIVWVSGSATSYSFTIEVDYEQAP